MSECQAQDERCNSKGQEIRFCRSPEERVHPDIEDRGGAIGRGGAGSRSAQKIDELSLLLAGR